MSHLVQLTDEHDNFLGFKQRDEVIDSDTVRIIAVDIHDPTDEYILIQKRSMQKTLQPWKWTVAVAGTLEKDDTYELCAVRELEEELWIRGSVLKAGGKSFYKDATLGYRQRVLYTTYISMDTSFILQESEVDEVRWIAREDLKKWARSIPDDFTEWSLRIWQNTEVI